MTDATLISEVEYYLRTVGVCSKAASLLDRAVKELKQNKRELARLEKSNSDYMWEKYPDRMGS